MERKTASKLAGQFVERNIEADPGIEDHLHAHALDQIEFAAEHRLGQPVLGNGEAQHAARLAALFKDGHLVAQHGQIEGGGQAGGTCTGHGHLAACRLQLARQNALHHRLEAVGLINLVGDEAVHLAHVHHFVEGLAAAAIVAGMLADPARGGGQGIVENHRLEGVFKAAFLVELEEARNVHAQRATVFAGRQRQLLADTGAAAVGHDVIFILLAEVADGGQHGIGRGLAKAAERTLADHAAELVEQCEVLARFHRPW